MNCFFVVFIILIKFSIGKLLRNSNNEPPTDPNKFLDTKLKEYSNGLNLVFSDYKNLISKYNSSTLKNVRNQKILTSGMENYSLLKNPPVEISILNDSISNELIGNNVSKETTDFLKNVNLTTTKISQEAINEVLFQDKDNPYFKDKNYEKQLLELGLSKDELNPIILPIYSIK